MKRWEDHIGTCNRQINKSKLYEDMRLYGIEKFTFQILGSQIPEEELDEKEKYYIQKYNATNGIYGYNVTCGGNKETVTKKLSKENVLEIIEMLKNGRSLKYIANIFNVDVSTISDINNGDTWRFEKEKYPIVTSVYKRKNFSKDDITTIYNRLMNHEKASTIAKDFNTSITTISKINHGKIYAKEGIKYPIYIQPNSVARATKDQIKQIVNLLTETNLNIVQISRKTHIGRKTISAINKGSAYIDVLKKLGVNKFPIRK